MIFVDLCPNSLYWLLNSFQTVRHTMPYLKTDVRFQSNGPVTFFRKQARPSSVHVSAATKLVCRGFCRRLFAITAQFSSHFVTITGPHYLRARLNREHFQLVCRGPSLCQRGAFVRRWLAAAFSSPSRTRAACGK